MTFTSDERREVAQMDEEVVYEMETITKGGERYARELRLTLTYKPEDWILDRITHEEGIIQASETDFVSVGCIVRISFHKEGANDTDTD